FVLVVTNRDKTAEEFESRELRIEKVIPPGKTVRLRVPALKAGTYPFVGEYHENTAKGRIIAESAIAPTFVVTLREGFEAALLPGIVYACLDRFGARDHYRCVTLGGALGPVASSLMGL